MVFEFSRLYIANVGFVFFFVLLVSSGTGTKVE
jgi:hypothetical protein